MPAATHRYEVVDYVEAEHLAPLYADLRAVDVEEWEASCAQLSLDAKLRLISDLPYSKAILVDGVCVAVFGVVRGNVWLIASNAAVPHARAIHRRFKHYVDLMQAQCPDRGYLAAASLVTNRVHHAWLRRLGFLPHRRFVVDTGSVFIEFRRECATP